MCNGVRACRRDPWLQLPGPRKHARPRKPLAVTQSQSELLTPQPRPCSSQGMRLEGTPSRRHKGRQRQRLEQ